MFCPKCGKELPDGAKFCPSCGGNIPSNDHFQQQEQEQQQQQQQQTPIEEVFPSVQQRSIPLYIILTLVTCGIFGIYWMICLANDVNTASKHPNDTTGVVVWLLGMITCGIYSLIWIYQAGSKIDEVQEKKGLPSGSNGVVYLILSLVGLPIVAYGMMQNELNKLSKN